MSGQDGDLVAGQHVEPVLTEEFVLAYDYRRSVGPVLGAFFTALAEGRILGSRTAGGDVVVPPTEYDPLTGAACDEWVEVGTCGVVVSWTWQADPSPAHPLQHPFAWALIRLDGATIPLLHAVDVGEPAAISTGLRVRAVFAEQATGSITDLCFFVPQSRAPLLERPPSPPKTPGPPVKRIITPTRLEYVIPADVVTQRYLLALAEKRIEGRRCGDCGKVYVPPRGVCPVCAVVVTECVDLPGTGVVTTFCIVNVPFEGQLLDPPYACAHILLDGADLPLFHLIDGCAASEVRMGLRVRVCWADDAVRAADFGAILYFAPTGEPDAAYESYKDHV